VCEFRLARRSLGSVGFQLEGVVLIRSRRRRDQLHGAGSTLRGSNALQATQMRSI